MKNNVNIIQEIISFAKNPKENLDKLDPKKNFLKTFSFTFLMMLLGGFITVAVLAITGTTHGVSSFVLNTDSINVIIYAIIIGPLIEELAFRLFLKKKNKYNLAYGIAFFIIFSFTILFKNYLDLPKWFLSYTSIYGILSYIVSASIIALPIVGLFSIKPLFDKITDFLTRRFNYFFYCSAFSFGIMHLSNFSDILQYWYILPLFVLPQLIAGYFFGFMRIKFGFRWSYLGHFINNSIGILPILAMKFISPEITADIINGNYGALATMDVQSVVSISLISFFIFIAYTIMTLSVLKTSLNYLKSKYFSADTKQKIACLLTMVLPGSGHDFLGQEKSAKKYYKLTLLVGMLTFIPFLLPFTYESIMNAVITLSLPFIASMVLSHYSSVDMKKVLKQISLT